MGHLDLNDGAEAQAPAALRSSGDFASDRLQIQVTSAPPGRSRCTSASSSSSVSLAAGLQSSHLQATSAHRPGILIQDPKLWHHGCTLPFFGDEICNWAGSSCRRGCEATQSCHYSGEKIRHFDTSKVRPKFVYACWACWAKRRACFDEVLDLPR